MNRGSLTNGILFLNFILLATVFDLFTVENINFLFIGISVLGAFLLVLLHYKTFPIPKGGYLVIIFIFMVVVSLFNFSSTRWSSLGYSAFFVITFLVYTTVSDRHLEIGRFRTLLKVVFYLYFIGLIAGQLSVYFNFFAPLSGIIGFMRGSFGTILEREGIRFFSLSSEPSYAALIVLTIFYTYLKLDPSPSPIRKRENLFLFGILVYMILVFKSGYGVLLLGFLLLEFVGISSTLLIMGVVIGGAALLIGVFDYDSRAIDRIADIITKVDFSNPHSLYAIDFTAYFRIAPILHYVETADFTELNFLFGHGAGTSKYYIVPEIYGGYLNGEFRGGLFPAYFYEYGIIGGVSVMIFMASQLPRFLLFPAVLTILMCLNANFNTQLFWFVLLCFHLLKVFYAQRTSSIFSDDNPSAEVRPMPA